MADDFDIEAYLEAQVDVSYITFYFNDQSFKWRAKDMAKADSSKRDINGGTSTTGGGDRFITAIIFKSVLEIYKCFSDWCISFQSYYFLLQIKMIGDSRS